MFSATDSNHSLLEPTCHGRWMLVMVTMQVVGTGLYAWAKCVHKNGQVVEQRTQSAMVSTISTPTYENGFVVTTYEVGNEVCYTLSLSLVPRLYLYTE